MGAKSILRFISKYLFADATLRCHKDECSYRKRVPAEDVIFTNLYGNSCPECGDVLMPEYWAPER